MNKTTCKHFNGIQNDCCDANVNYKSVTTDPEVQLGWALRIPCIIEHKRTLSPGQQSEYDRRGTCSKFELPTKEEVKAYKEEVKKSTARFIACQVVVAPIRKAHKGRDWSGIIECPICKGKLHIRHTGYNGHVWGKCETENCVSWIE